LAREVLTLKTLFTALFAATGLNQTDPNLLLVGLCLVLSCILSLLFTPISIKLAHRFGVLDTPGERRVHKHPIPRWGGLAMSAAFIVSIFLITPLRQWLTEGNMINSRVAGIVIGGVLVTILGAIDDKYSVSPKVKLLGQIICAAVMVICFNVRPLVIFDFDLINNPNLEIYSYIIGIIWVVAITNTINLIDGLDGLAAGTCGIVAMTFVTIAMVTREASGEAMLAAALAGVCLGFLRYNFNPARVFMGDAGSHFLGFTIAGLSLLHNWKVATGVAFAVPILVLAVPIFDTLFAIIRRAWRHQPIFSADKGHLHHRLLALGMNQRLVVLTIYLLTAVCCIVAVILARGRMPQ
jgi:UDP-GlcNAc:undecaprenyl-phosphate GlcNAc-1-phosphate transferase